MSITYVNNFNDTSIPADGEPWNYGTMKGPAINYEVEFYEPYFFNPPQARLTAANNPPDPATGTLVFNSGVGLSTSDFAIQLFYQPAGLETGQNNWIIAMGEGDGSASWCLRHINGFNTIQFVLNPQPVPGDPGETIVHSRQSNSGGAYYTVTRKDGWVGILTGESPSTRSYYPGYIGGGGALHVGGSSLLVNNSDPYSAGGSYDTLSIDVGNGFDPQVGIGTGNTPTTEPDDTPGTIVINRHPEDTTADDFGAATFLIEATSTDGTIVYQWYADYAAFGGGVVPVGTDSNTFTVNDNTEYPPDVEFYAILTNNSATAQSRNAVYVVGAASSIEITRGPSYYWLWVGGYVPGGTIYMSATTQLPPLSYEWRWGDDNSVIAGSSDSRYMQMVPVLEENNGRDYYCRITEQGGGYLDSSREAARIVWAFLLSQDNVTGDAGDAVTIICTPNDPPSAVWFPLQSYSTLEWRYADGNWDPSDPFAYVADELISSGPWSSPFIDLVLTEDMNGRGIYAVVNPDEQPPMCSEVTTLVVGPPPPEPPAPVEPADPRRREMLVYNWEDDNYGWADAGFDTGLVIDGAICMQYIYDPGWQTRWSDLQDAGTLWSDFDAAGTLWSDFYAHGTERNIYYLTAYGLYKADQVIKTDGIKQYFVRRFVMDLDEMDPTWTTNNWKHLRQFYFHAKTPRPVAGELPNTFVFTTGWSASIMDAPSWNDQITVNLQQTEYDGVPKIDLRTTGRYLSMNISFDKTQEFEMTGGDMDLELAHGR